MSCFNSFTRHRYFENVWCCRSTGSFPITLNPGTTLVRLSPEPRILTLSYSWVTREPPRPVSTCMNLFTYSSTCVSLHGALSTVFDNSDTDTGIWSSVDRTPPASQYARAEGSTSVRGTAWLQICLQGVDISSNFRALWVSHRCLYVIRKLTVIRAGTFALSDYGHVICVRAPPRTSL